LKFRKIIRNARAYRPENQLSVHVSSAMKPQIMHQWNILLVHNYQAPDKI